LSRLQPGSAVATKAGSYVNRPAISVRSRVLTTDLTDHYAVLAAVERRAPRSDTHTDTESGTYLYRQELN
ncbi:hypothetical protein J6590_084579, partial [Homalodisca vitripennis]